MVVAGCVLLEYGVATAAVSVGWSGYVNKLLHNLFGFQVPHALAAAPWGSTGAAGSAEGSDAVAGAGAGGAG